MATLDGKGRDGRERIVAVPVESYRAIDHGYATTIHKTQGATVDKAFVLASKTMDRHLAYVGMTRHREGVELHASREEFRGGMEGLSKSLSRDGAKETTLDYEIRDFAERRGIRVPEAIARVVAKAFDTLPLPKPAFVERMSQGAMAGKERAGRSEQDRTARAEPMQGQGREGQKQTLPLMKEQAGPDRSGLQDDLTPAASPGEKSRERTGEVPAASPPTGKRDMFSGLRLEAAGDRARPETSKSFAGLKLPEPVRAAPPEKGERAGISDVDSRRDQLLRMTEGYARTYADAARMRDLGLPVVEHQKVALEKAAAGLDAVHPDARPVLESALRHDPETRRVMMEAKGAERAAGLVAGMGRERQAQQDPEIRAERFATRWTGLQQEHDQLRGAQHGEARGKVEAAMREVAGEISRDAQAESVLRRKQEALGITRDSALGRALEKQDKPVAQGLEESLDKDRQRGQGHSM